MNSFQENPARNLPLIKSPQPGERRARGWQIAITLVAAIAIVVVFLWGINNQRPEGGNEQTAATQPAPATPHSANPQGAPAAQNQPQKAPSTTTGQGGSDQPDNQPGRSKDQTTRQQSKPPQQNAPPGAGSGGRSSQPPKAQ